MIRLNFKNSKIQYWLESKTDNAPNLFLIKNRKEDSEIETSFNEELTKNNILKLANNYTEFLTYVKEANSYKLPGLYFCFLEDDILHVFQSICYSNITLIYCFSYKPENKKLLELTKELFRFSDGSDRTPTTFQSFFKNNYNFLTNYFVLSTIYTAEAILASGEEIYSVFKKKCKNGKIREIVAPHEKIKSVLKNLNNVLQKIYDKRNSNFQIAYKKGKNIKSGAVIHKNHKFIYNLDLKDFFPSCKKQYVQKYLNFLFAYSYNRFTVEEYFYKIILKDDALFIGSPISGTIANAILSMAFSYMNNICHNHGISLSVYADDITVSSNRFLSYEYVKNVFNEAFSKYKLEDNFKLNEKKSKGQSNNRRNITGVRINHRDELTISRMYFKELRTQIHHLSLGDNVNINKLRGKIAYASMIDESGKLLRYLAKYYDTVKENNLCPKLESKILDIKQKGV